MNRYEDVPRANPGEKEISDMGYDPREKKVNGYPRIGSPTTATHFMVNGEMIQRRAEGVGKDSFNYAREHYNFWKA